MALASWIVVALPALWVAGLSVNDAGRGLAILLAALAVWKRREIAAVTFDPSFLQKRFLGLFLVLFTTFTATQQICETLVGRQGIDFAIFTQVVDSIARRGGPFTSLIAMEWKNFLAHHFVPYLYLPGAITLLGAPAFVSISLVHAVGIAFALWALGLSAKRLGYSPAMALFAVVLLCANPTFRHGVLFAVHDEVFALPFLGFAFYFWLSARAGLTALMLGLTLLTKESMSFVVAMFALMTLLDRDTPRFPKPLAWLFLAIGLVGFPLYAFVLPKFLDKGFDHANKLATFAELFRPDWLGAKLLLFVFLGLPFLMFPLWRRSTWHLLLPAAPLLGFVFISRFEEMWHLLNYYGVLPTYVFAFATLIAFKRSRWGSGEGSLPVVVAAFLVALSFSWSGKKPIKVLVDAMNGPRVAAAQLAMIPDEAKVIANPPGALLLFRTAIVWRTWLANHYPPADFDFIVMQPGEAGDIGPPLLEASEICHEDSAWQIRCRKGGSLSLEKKQKAVP